MEVKTPFNSKETDFWLISDNLQDEVCKANIIPSIKSDHSPITLSLESIEVYKHGPSHWKFNSSFIEDTNFVKMSHNKYPQWLNEYNDMTDKRVLWYIIKYKIRQETMRYGKETAAHKRKSLQDAENHLKDLEEKVANDPNTDNIKQLGIGKLKYENIYDYITRGTILHSRVKWYEEGEKNNKYF